MRITTKRQFLDLYLAGVLGNRFQVWRDYESCLKDHPEEVGLREMAIGAGSFEMVDYEKIQEAAIRWLKAGKSFYLNASDKNHLSTLLIQGELCHTFRGYSGYIGHAHGLRMRDMFKAGYAQPRGFADTRHIMKEYMDANTLEDVDGLFDLYPTATIEFACYSRDIGVIPNRNTIIWEVRDY